MKILSNMLVFAPPAGGDVHVALTHGALCSSHQVDLVWFD